MCRWPQGGSYLNDKQQITSRPVNGELEWMHIFSSSLMNELKFGFNRGNVYTTNQSALDTPFAVSVSGFTTLANNEYKIGVGNSYSYIDNLTMVRGNHLLKFGAEVRRIQLNQGNTSGTVSFSSTANFLVNSVSSATYAAELPVNGLRKTEVYSYAEDEWKLRPNLTLNLGVRYSFYNIFHEVTAKPFHSTLRAAGRWDLRRRGQLRQSQHARHRSAGVGCLGAHALSWSHGDPKPALACITAMDSWTTRSSISNEVGRYSLTGEDDSRSLLSGDAIL